jgi:hypothetical protein
MSKVYALHRVEPISREGDPGRGLAAPVHDPLWGLARQRQFGELAGEDTGSPVQVAMRLRVDPLDGWRPAGTEELLPYDPDRQVLEAVVAGEPAGPPTAPRTEAEMEAVRSGEQAYAARVRDRLDAGRRLAAALPGTTTADLLAQFPVVTRPDDARLVRRAAAVYPDGIAVARAVNATRGADDGDLAEALGTTTVRVSEHRDALEAHAAWCETTFGTGPATWHAERLERRFDLASGEQVVLTAPAHTRETVDVADLDATDALGGLTLPPGQRWVRRVPTRLRFPGMPNERFWEFEDARLSLARIDAATHDLARLALVEFSSTYGNDWFTFPVPVDHGTVVTVPEVVVRDTFGRDELVPVASSNAWSMFEAGRATGPQRLVVPSVTVGRLAGPVVEEVRFVRDENANLVWGLEAVVTDEAGVTHDVVAAYAAADRERPPLPEDADLLYQLMTDVPDHWVPFVPVHVRDERPGAPEPEHRAVALVEAVLPRPGAYGVMVTPVPRSSILTELRGVPLHEEEVGPAGVTVRRRWFLARSADGGRHVWVARSVSAGRGEGASGLMFDVAVDVALETRADRGPG